MPPSTQEEIAFSPKPATLSAALLAIPLSGSTAVPQCARERSEHAHLAVAPRCAKKLTSPGAAPITSADPADTSAAHAALAGVMVAVRVRRDRPYGRADEGADERDRERPRVGAVDDLLKDVAAGQAGWIGARADVCEVGGHLHSCQIEAK